MSLPPARGKVAAGRMRGDVSAAAPYMDNRDNAAPHQPPAGGSFSQREKPLCKEMKK